MLGKLIKYEIKASARVFLTLYAGLIVFALLNRIFGVTQTHTGFLGLLSALLMIAYSVLVASIFVITFVVMIQRFYRNFLKDEGYLMFTLPVKPWQLIVSKLTVSVMWVFASGILVMLSVMIMIWNANIFQEIQQGFQVMNYYIGQIFGSVGLVYLETFALMLVSTIVSILMIYAAISIGSLFKNRVLGMFVGFFGTYISVQLINALFVSIFDMADPFFYQRFMASESAMHTALWLLMAFELTIGIGFFFVSKYIFTKRLNLE